MKESAEHSIEELSYQKKDLTNEKRCVGISPKQQTDISAQMAGLSIQLKALRKEVRLCKEIEERAQEIARKNEQVKAQQSIQKEEAQRTSKQKNR